MQSRRRIQPLFLEVGSQSVSRQPLLRRLSQSQSVRWQLAIRFKRCRFRAGSGFVRRSKQPDFALSQMHDAVLRCGAGGSVAQNPVLGASRSRSKVWLRVMVGSTLWVSSTTLSPKAGAVAITPGFRWEGRRWLVP
jgi:hypothetical protein